MLFSERYGYKKAEMLKKDEMPDHLRTRIWNVFDLNVFGRFNIRDPLSSYTETTAKFIFNLWNKFLKRNTDEIKGVGSRHISLMVKQEFYDLQGSEIYEFINFFLKTYQGKITEDKVLVKLSEVLEEECAPYRIIDGKVIPLISKEEIKEIEKTLNIPDKYKSVSDHLSKALELFSKRPKADYENSIKESISAVDLLVQIILGKEGTLGKLVDGLDIHPALKKAFSNLYGWTSDDAGIRHPKSKEPLSCDEPEARYMLVTCSAFINYVTAKHETKQ